MSASNKGNWIFRNKDPHKQSFAEKLEEMATYREGLGGTTSSGTTAATPFLTYDDLIAQGKTPSEAVNYVNWTNAYQTAEAQRAEAERRAEVERQRGVVDARASYTQNLSAHGANAEALAGAGLTGSGYSDYLASRAYSQMRADTQAANAQKTKTVNEALYTEGQAKAAADSVYYSNLKTIGDEKNAAYATLLGGASDGTYTADQIPELAKNAGLDETQTQNIVNAANDYKTKSQALASGSIAESLGDTIGAIDAAIAAGTITPEQGAERKESLTKQNYASFESGIQNATDDNPVDTSEIDNAFARGDIDQPQYEALKAKWNDSVISSAGTFFKNEDGQLYSKSEAKELLDSISKHSWISPQAKNSLLNKFRSLYEYTTNDIELVDDGRLNKLSKSGKKFYVKDKYTDTYWHIETGGECTDKLVIDVASDAPGGTVFGYQKKLYIKSGGKVYSIKESDTSEYEKLYKRFFG